MRDRFRSNDESGFTLIELIAVIAITGIIVTAIGGAIIVGLATTDDTSVRLGESHDTQVASAYLANDTQSANTISGTACGTGSPVVSFAYADGSIASYNFGTVSGEQRLTRAFCPDNTSVTLAHLVGNSAPTATCDGGACTAGTKPNRVKIQVTEGTGYGFSVTGARRAFSASGSPIAPSVTTLMLLGSGVSHLDKDTQINVNGNMMYNGSYTTDQGAAFNVAGSISKPAVDPLASMPAPTVTGTGSCSGSGSTRTCTPGVYSSPLTFGANFTVTFQPGYYRLAGITFGQGGTWQSSGPVLIYMNTGSFTFGKNMNATLTPPGAGDPYAGLVYYQPTSTVAPIIDQGSQLTSTNGIFYAPKIELHADQGALNGFKALIVGTLDIDQGSTIVFGP